MLNLLSMTPYGFAATSHLGWTIYFSLSICLGIFILGILKHKISFFKIICTRSTICSISNDDSY